MVTVQRAIEMLGIPTVLITVEPEESALLASLVRRCDPALHARIGSELADDIEWLSRLHTIPEPLRVLRTLVTVPESL